MQQLKTNAAKTLISGSVCHYKCNYLCGPLVLRLVIAAVRENLWYPV